MKKILFVDDEQNQLNTWKRSLNKMKSDWEMVFLQDSNRVIHEVENTPFDVIILDVIMPGKDGFELLEQLVQADNTKSIPVIMVTGAGQKALKRRALEIGATDLLDKPIDLDDLIARINSALRLKSCHDNLKHLNETLEKKVQERTAVIEEYRQDVIWRLAKAGEYRDKGTGNHVVRVGHFSRLLASILGLPDEEINTIFLASALHDIGKIGIPDAILLKPSRLTLEERRVMETHCEIGVQILQDYIVDRGVMGLSVDNPLLKTASQIALFHHERWDGHGYPTKLSEKNIPLESRIVSIADTYDALRSERPYKPAYNHAKTMAIMKSEAGAQFDPDVFDAFEQSQEEFRLIYNQYVDNPRMLREVA